MSKEVKETLDAKVTEENGTRQLNQYTIRKQLGQGSFGSVHLAYDNQHQRLVAIKECSKSKLRKQKALAAGPGRGRGRGRGTMRRVTISRPKVAAENPLDLVRTEIAILKKLDHPNVVKLYEALDDPTQDSLFMVFELCEKGCVLDLSLDKDVTPLSADLARSYFQQLILGIEYLHEHDIAHRDIKPDNMMIAADGTLKIVDFGVSEMFSKGNAAFNKTAGSPAFYPPECCVNKGLPAMPGDIWAMGVTLFALCFGRLPFTGKSIMQLYESIRENEPDYPADADPRLLALLKRLLDKDADSRITIPELRDDKWVTDNGTKTMIPFEENCKEENVVITQSDIDAAVKPVQSLFTVMKAITKLKAKVLKRKIANWSLPAETPKGYAEVAAPVILIQEDDASGNPTKPEPVKQSSPKVSFGSDIVESKKESTASPVSTKVERPLSQTTEKSQPPIVSKATTEQSKSKDSCSTNSIPTDKTASARDIAPEKAGGEQPTNSILHEESKPTAAKPSSEPHQIKNVTVSEKPKPTEAIGTPMKKEVTTTNAPQSSSTPTPSSTAQTKESSTLVTSSEKAKVIEGTKTSIAKEGSIASTNVSQSNGSSTAGTEPRPMARPPQVSKVTPDQASSPEKPSAISKERPSTPSSANVRQANSTATVPPSTTAKTQQSSKSLPAPAAAPEKQRPTEGAKPSTPKPKIPTETSDAKESKILSKSLPTEKPYAHTESLPDKSSKSPSKDPVKVTPTANATLSGSRPSTANSSAKSPTKTSSETKASTSSKDSSKLVTKETNDTKAVKDVSPKKVTKDEK